MLNSATGGSVRAGLSPRTIACTSDGVWLWPATPLTERRGSRLVPVPTWQLFAQLAALHGPRLHAAGLEHALRAAASHLKCGPHRERREVLAALDLPPVTLQGATVIESDRAPPRHRFSRCRGRRPAAGRRAVRSSSLAQVHDRKLVQARRLEGEFNPTLRRIAPADGPFDPTPHPRWPGGQSDGGRFQPREGSGVGVVVLVAARAGERARFPSGQSYRPELKQLIEPIANATPEEATELHYEIEARYGRYGDQAAAAVLHNGFNLDDICPCCGVQFGYHDARRSHEELRPSGADELGPNCAAEPRRLRDPEVDQAIFV